MDQKEIAEIVRQMSAELGITDWEITCTASASVSAGMMNDELVDFSSSRDCDLTVRVIMDGREGSATGERLDEQTVRRLVSLALENSVVRPSEPECPPYVMEAGKTYPEKRGREGHSASVSQIIACLERTQKALFASDHRVAQGTGSDAASVECSTFVENSRGLSLSQSWKSSYIDSSVVVKSDGEVRSGYVAVEGDIAHSDTLRAVDRAISCLGAGTPASGRCPVAFSPECMTQMLSAFWPAFSGKNAALNLSPYRGRTGEQIASQVLTLIDDPLYPDYPAQAVFDGDCMPVYTKTVIEDGVLRTLLYNRQWAMKAGCESTGNGITTSSGSSICPYSFYIKPSDLSLDGLLGMMDSGIYVTGMKGFHAGANSVSGDFSIESSGFLVENGRLGAPADGFTVAGNFFDMLRSVSAVADDLDFQVTLSPFRTGSPSVLVSMLSIAGKQ